MNRASPVKAFCCALLGLFLASASSTALATPSIGIGSMYDILVPGKQALTKRIYNTGTSTAFVRVDLLEIHPQKTAKALEVPVKDIAGNALVKNRLIVTPLRMIIPPSGFQTVRIIWPGDRTAERYYRVRFTPVMPETGDGFGLSNKEISEYRNKALSAGLNVMAGYGTLVMIQPAKPVFNTQFLTASSDSITVKNQGNATIALENIRHCKVANTDCGSASREFILPGRSKNINKKKDFSTNFTLIEGEKQKKLSF